VISRSEEVTPLKFTSLLWMQPEQQFEEEWTLLKSLITKLNRTRAPFAVKIHHILEFVKKYPEPSEKTGVIWSKLFGVFLVNNRLLTLFLGIKSNSINTNFHEHREV
jgi:hypothetical protein